MSTRLVEVFRGAVLRLSNPNIFSKEIPLEGYLAKAILRLNFVLTNTTGTGAKPEGELQIVKKVSFTTNKGDTPFDGAPGRLLYRVDEKKNGTPSVKDAASVTAGTFRVDLVLNFIDPLSANPYETILNLRNFESAGLELIMGSISDWLTTPGDAALTVTADCYFEVVDELPAGVVEPRVYQVVGVQPPVDPSGQTYIPLETSDDLLYKRLYLFTTNGATAGVTHTGTANGSVISELNFETTKGFIVKPMVADILNRRNKQDYRLETRVTGEYIIDMIKDGNIRRALPSGFYKSKLRINWTNDTLSTSQVSLGYEGVRDLAA